MSRRLNESPEVADQNTAARHGRQVRGCARPAALALGEPVDARARLTILALLLATSPALPTAAQDRIVLRNLEIISDKAVASFDLDGVRLDDGRLITWDWIERARIKADQQDAFNQMLTELGMPLYRIRQRLEVGDYKGLLKPAESIAGRYSNRKSKSSYMVLQALMWGHLANGQREAALAPYLQCYAMQRALKGRSLPLPGPRRMQVDLDTGFCHELLPIWFDAAAAKEALPGVVATLRKMNQPPEATRIYYATLALTAGEQAGAGRLLRSLQSEDRLMKELGEVVLIHLEAGADYSPAAADKLEKLIPKLQPAPRALALYWLGQARLKSDQRRVQRLGVLSLLHVPALLGEKYPDLSAACLYHSYRTLASLQDPAGSLAVRRELLDSFGQTYHANLERQPPSSGDGEDAT